MVKKKTKTQGALGVPVQKVVAYILCAMHTALCSAVEVSDADRVARLDICEGLLHVKEVREWANGWTDRMKKKEFERLAEVVSELLREGRRRTVTQMIGKPTEN